MERCAIRRRSSWILLTTTLVVVLVQLLLLLSLLPPLVRGQALLPPLLSVLPPAGDDDAALTVELDGYGRFLGRVVTTNLANAPLPTPVRAWLGINYAEQPVKDLRFSVVGPPKPFAELKPATEYGPICVQGPAAKNVRNQDEACLSLNVFRPEEVVVEGDALLPVLVWIHGGGFQSGYGGAWDGAMFVASAATPLMVVSFNYRLNSLGFLPSQLFQDQGLLNLGLHDQHELLQFVQKHIHQFGGDPSRVTLGGQSAGAHSTGFHYQYQVNDSDALSLFSQVIMQSGGPTARTYPNSSYPLYQEQYASFLSGVGCSTAQTEDVLQCLRKADISLIRKVSYAIYSASIYHITWPFQPARNGFMLESAGSANWASGTFHHLPVLTSSTTDEGRLFTPHDLSTSAQFVDFMQTIAPDMTSDHLAEMASLYPDPVADPTTSPYTNSPISLQYTRISAAYSDYAYICPVRETAERVSSSPANISVWKSHWNTPNALTPPWQGIPHGVDIAYTVNSPRVKYPPVAHAQHAYWVSFIATGDPNPLRWPGTPEWPRYYESGVGPGTGADAEPGQQIRVDPAGVVVERDVLRREECRFWNGIAGELNR